MRRNWLLIFVLSTLLGLLSFSTARTAYLLENENVPYQYPLINELTGAYSVFVLLPALLWFLDEYRIRRKNWLRLVPLHLLVTTLFGIAHTTLMTISRSLLYPVFLSEPYEMGDLFYRYFMEFHKQVFIYLLILGVVEFLRYHQNARERERKTAELELQAAHLESKLTQAQLHSLQGRLQPHFLFNTLNMISSVMYEDVKKADRMMMHLSTLLRMSLEFSDRQKVSLQQEIATANHYAELMKSRFEEKLRIRLDIAPGIEDALIPAFLLQPLLENAIKHHSWEHTVEIVIDIVRELDHLLIKIEDNGPGVKNEDAIFDKGVGLSNTRERLRHLYGNRFVLEAANRPQSGFSVQIAIPYESAGVQEVETEIHEAARADRG